jgi:hypothetical protein
MTRSQGPDSNRSVCFLAVSRVAAPPERSQKETTLISFEQVVPFNPGLFQYFKKSPAWQILLMKRNDGTFPGFGMKIDVVTPFHPV